MKRVMLLMLVSMLMAGLAGGEWAPGPTSNQPPIARDDTAETKKDTSVVIDVLVNDTDPDKDELTVYKVTQPKYGAVVIVGDQVVYTPDQGEQGPDSPESFSYTDEFSYTVSDGHGGFDTAVVGIVPDDGGDSPNQSPVARNDKAETEWDTPVVIDVLGNDTDPDDDELRLESVTQPQNGAVVIIGDAGVYTPKPGFYGNDTFSYTVSDGRGGYDTAMVVVGIVQPGPPPNK